MTPLEPTKVYSPSTIALMIFKSLRAERNMHQAYIAELLEIGTSAWNRLENGQYPLSFEMFHRVCAIFQVPGSLVMSTMELITIYLYGAGFYQRDLSSKEDDLLPLVRAYFKQPHLPSWNPLAGSHVSNSLLSNWSLQGDLPDVIRYCTDPSYREGA